MAVKNNITRFLDARNINYEAFELSTEKHSAEETAAMLGVPPEIAYKTIVIVREKKGKPILCMVPATAEVDLKKLVRALGDKKLPLCLHPLQTTAFGDKIPSTSQPSALFCCPAPRAISASAA